MSRLCCERLEPTRAKADAVIKQAVALIISMLFSTLTVAVEFSAETMQSTATQPKTSGKLFVGTWSMRRESTNGDQALIEIFDTRSATISLLLPARKQYIQRTMPSGFAIPGSEVDADPCKQAVADGVTCRLLGEESVMGRKALKWSISGLVNGSTVTAVHWIDRQHKFPLRQQVGERVVLEQRYIGDEAFEGRNVERWETVSTSADGKAVKAVRWYDPELRIPLRQEMSNGFKQALHNIRIEAQSDELFVVPLDYQMLEQ